MAKKAKELGKLAAEALAELRQRFKRWETGRSKDGHFCRVWDEETDEVFEASHRELGEAITTAMARAVAARIRREQPYEGVLTFSNGDAKVVFGLASSDVGVLLEFSQGGGKGAQRGRVVLTWEDVEELMCWLEMF